MNKSLDDYYLIATQHRVSHACGGVPYQHGDVLSAIVAVARPLRVLELGTGVGYSAACILNGYDKTLIETIDQDSTHLAIANENWQKLGIAKRVTTHCDKAEVVLPRLSGSYDLIFADGYEPSMKFLLHFERLLKKGGVLLTANLFLKDPQGGRYLRELLKSHRWQTGVFGDTALSVKLF
jgi:predicted O-methyltransferase YrrM